MNREYNILQELPPEKLHLSPSTKCLEFKNILFIDSIPYLIPGHGGSDGLHAYVHSLDDAVTDMVYFNTHV